MIPLDLLRGITTVIGHAREDAVCADALAAVLVVRDVLPDVEVRFLRYESKEHQEVAAEPGVLFVDISPPPDRVGEFLEMNSIVLDHHATAAKETRAFELAERGVYADLHEQPGVSAATLAFRYIWEPIVANRRDDDGALAGFGQYHGSRPLYRDAVRRFAELAGIRDTWQITHPLWIAASEQAAVLLFYPLDVWLDTKKHGWSPIGVGSFEERFRVGPHLLRRHQDEVRSLVSGAHRFTTPKGTRVAVCSSSVVSDAADLLDDVDVVVGFSFRVREGGPSMKLAFRSRGGFVVRPIAEALGGGGHDGAASAWIELHASHRHPYATIRTIMEGW